jgi:hypothetical protein
VSLPIRPRRPVGNLQSNWLCFGNRAGHNRARRASPRTALDLLARIQHHQARIGERAVGGLSTTTPEQLELFETLSLPKPA